MRVGIIELLIGSAPPLNWMERAYTAYFVRQFAGVPAQAVSVWCRQLGHEVFYATYYGQEDPKRLLPGDLDIVFVAAFTQASALAYALAKLFRKEKTLTVIGGPHAKSFPEDCLRFFDLAVGNCDKALIEDILRGRFDPPAAISNDRPLTDMPGVEERMPEISVSSLSRGRPAMLSIIPLLSSVGCPYDCDFCVDWNNDYVSLPRERMEADLRYLAENWPGITILYHDPNFGVQFDQTMDIIEAIPEGSRNPYVMESSLSILKESRLHRLRDTNCVFVAPGVESWASYSNKAGCGAKSGREKMERVAGHFEQLQRYVGGLQANFIFGTDVDRGKEPIELTKEFIRLLPSVWPTLNIPTPLRGTPLYDKYLAEGRILKSMPFIFYFTQTSLVTTLINYHPVEYYDHLIEIGQAIASTKMLTRRLFTAHTPRAIRALHILRTMAVRLDIAEFRRIRKMLATDTHFRAFHEGRSEILPEFYHREFERKLGPYAEFISRRERRPSLGEGHAVYGELLNLVAR